MTNTVEQPEREEQSRLLSIEGGAIQVHGILYVPENAHGMVVLARGIQEEEEGSIRRRVLAQTQPFHEVGLATLIVDLFNEQERRLDEQTGYFAQNIDILQQRLIGVADWLAEQPGTDTLSIGIFGVDAVGAAILSSADERPDVIRAVVAAGNSVQLAKDIIPNITVPTLLIAPANDTVSANDGREAVQTIKAKQKHFEAIEGTTTLFESEIATKKVLELARDWFNQHLHLIPGSESTEL
jgi:putative phosphoribosyl transferase